jgi:hypothetical protein
VAHISRKELKQDKFRESLEHGAEAVISHRQFSAVLIGLVAAIVLGTFGWRMYAERQNVKAGAELDEAMKIYLTRAHAPIEPGEPGELTYADDNVKLQDAERKFDDVAARYPRTNAGLLARYYGALCLEELNRFNEALEGLRKIESGSDKELAGLARYQMAVAYARSGKPDESIKLLRQMAEHPTVLVPKPMVLLELGAQLRRSNPQAAAGIYNQIKKDYPDSAVSEEAQRELDALPPKS